MRASRVLLVIVACVSTASPAAADPILLLTDAATDADRALRASWAARGEEVSLVSAADSAAALARTDATLLAMDARSCGLLSRAASLRRACVSVRAQDVPAGIAAVTGELSWDAQLALVARALPGRTRVIVLRAPGRTALDAELTRAASAAGLTLTLVDVRAPGEAVPSFQAALRAAGAAPVLLAIPDRAVFTADTVAPLAQAAMSARVPLVGFSPYFLKIGAIAAFRVDTESAALRALALARARGGETVVEPSASGALVVDGRLAARLGLPVRAGEGVEVRK